MLRSFYSLPISLSLLPAALFGNLAATIDTSFWRRGLPSASPACFNFLFPDATPDLHRQNLVAPRNHNVSGATRYWLYEKQKQETFPGNKITAAEVLGVEPQKANANWDGGVVYPDRFSEGCVCEELTKLKFISSVSGCAIAPEGRQFLRNGALWSK